MMKNVGITSEDCWSLSTGLWPLCREYQVASSQVPVKRQAVLAAAVGGHHQTPRTVLLLRLRTALSWIVMLLGYVDGI